MNAFFDLPFCYFPGNPVGCVNAVMHKKKFFSFTKRKKSFLTIFVWKSFLGYHLMEQSLGESFLSLWAFTPFQKFLFSPSLIKSFRGCASGFAGVYCTLEFWVLYQQCTPIGGTKSNFHYSSILFFVSLIFFSFSECCLWINWFALGVDSWYSSWS